jgi:hypothetical protein
LPCAAMKLPRLCGWKLERIVKRLGVTGVAIDEEYLLVCPAHYYSPRAHFEVVAEVALYNCGHFYTCALLVHEWLEKLTQVAAPHACWLTSFAAPTRTLQVRQKSLKLGPRKYAESETAVNA